MPKREHCAAKILKLGVHLKLTNLCCSGMSSPGSPVPGAMKLLCIHMAVLTTILETLSHWEIDLKAGRHVSSLRLYQLY